MTAGAPDPTRPVTATPSASRPADEVGYHGQPILKAPVWSWEIPLYFFIGGIGGASAGLAYGNHLRGDTLAARRAWLVALGALAVSPVLLISDLGRPERFFNMLRMFKITSPMSVGSWVLAGTSAATGLATVDAIGLPLPGGARRAAAAARPTAALAGLSLATYTAALLATTAVPVWHEARRTLPLVFASGAALSAGAACTIATPADHAGSARRLALIGAAAELVSTELMHRRLGLHGEVYRSGPAGRWAKLSRAAIATGAGVLGLRGARHRWAAVGAGGLLCAGALATRWSVFAAGRASAADPRYVVEPQRARLGRTP